MSLGGEKCLWLCRLVDHCLRPFAVRFRCSQLLPFLFLVYIIRLKFSVIIVEEELCFSFFGE